MLEFLFYSNLVEDINKGRTSSALARIASGENFNTTSYLYPETPLHAAAKLGQIEIISELLRRGADMNVACYNNRQTPLHYAVANNQSEVVAFLLKKGAKLTTNFQGETALHLAARKKVNQSVSKTLMEFYSDQVDWQNKKGNTAAHIAIMNMNLSFLSILIDNKARIDIKNNRDESVLELAMSANVDNPEILNVVFNHGISIAEIFNLFKDLKLRGVQNGVEQKKAQSQIESLVRQNNNLLDQCTKLKSSLDVANSKIERLQLNQTYNFLPHSEAEAVKEIASLKKKNSILAESKLVIERTLRFKESELATVSQTVKNLKLLIDDLTVKNKSLQSAYDEKVRQVEQARGQSNLATKPAEEITFLKQQVNYLQKSKDQLESKVKSQDSALAESKKQLTQYEQDKAKLQAERDSFANKWKSVLKKTTGNRDASIPLAEIVKEPSREPPKNNKF